MKDKNKKIIAIVLIVIVAVLAIAAVIVSYRLQQAPVPTAPPSKPQAAEWLGAPGCNVSFTVAAPPPPPQFACTQKTVYRDVAANTSGNYQLTTANLLSSDSSTRLEQGKKYIFAVGYTNSGGSATSGSQITDVLDAKLNFVDATSGCTFNTSNRTVTCNIGAVAAGATGRVAIRVSVKSDATGAVNNAAQVTGGNTCSVSYTIGVPVISCVSKEAFKDEDDNTPGSYAYRQVLTTVAQNETFTYDIHARNSGDATASAITITDALTGENQSSLVFVDANQGCNYSSSTRTVTCQTTNVPPGTEVAFGFRVRVPSSAANGQIIKNLATVAFAATSSSCTKDLTVSGMVGCNSTCTSNDQCTGGLVCSGDKCRNSACAGEESCVCPTATPTGTPTPTPAPCRGACSSSVGCSAGLTCNNSICRNSTCPATDNDQCACPVAVVTTVTSVPTGVVTSVPTAAPTAAQLPSTGILNLPGATAFAGGLLLTILGILFAL